MLEKSYIDVIDRLDRTLSLLHVISDAINSNDCDWQSRGKLINVLHDFVVPEINTAKYEIETIANKK